MLLFVAFQEEREYVEKLGKIKKQLVSTFPFLDASNTEKLHLNSPVTTKGSSI